MCRRRATGLLASFDPRIEIGGNEDIHPEDAKIARLESEGFTALRVDNRDVAMDPLGVVGHIVDVVSEVRRR